MRLDPHVQQGEHQLAPPGRGHDLQPLLQTGDGLGVTPGLLLGGRQRRVKGGVVRVQFQAAPQAAAGLVEVAGRRGEPGGRQDNFDVVGRQGSGLHQVRGGFLRGPELLPVTRPRQVRLGRPVVGPNQLSHDLVGPLRVRQRTAQQPGQVHVGADAGGRMFDGPGIPIGGLLRGPEGLLTPRQLLFHLRIPGRIVQEGGPVVAGLLEPSLIGGQEGALAPRTIGPVRGNARRAALVPGPKSRVGAGGRRIGLPGEQQAVAGEQHLGVPRPENAR